MSAETASTQRPKKTPLTMEQKRQRSMERSITTESRIRGLQKKWKSVLAGALVTVGGMFAMDYDSTKKGETVYPIRSGALAGALTLAYAKVWHLLSKARKKNEEFSGDHSFIFERALASVEAKHSVKSNDISDDDDDDEESSPEVFGEMRKEYLDHAA